MEKEKSIVLVRHAQSEYNLAMMIALETTSEVKGVDGDYEDLDVKFNPELIDCSISAHGIEQVIIFTIFMYLSLISVFLQLKAYKMLILVW